MHVAQELIISGDALQVNVGRTRQGGVPNDVVDWRRLIVAVCVGETLPFKS